MVPYANSSTIRKPYSLVFVYASWNDLEPEEGRFAFDAWEKAEWSSANAIGKHVVFRVYVDYPTRASGLPNWLKAKGDVRRPFTNTGGGLV